MAYDRHENRGGWREDERGNRGSQRDYQGRGDDDRGFFERARDEVQSWFGDEEAERRRMQDERMGHPDSDRWSASGRDRDRERGAFFGGGRDDHSRDRGGWSGGYSRDDDRSSSFGGGQSTSYGRGREGGDYRNQYGRGSGESGGFGGGDYERQNRGYPSGYGQSGGGSFSSRQGRQESPWGREDRSDFGRSSRGSFGREDDDQYRPMAGDYGRSGGRQSYRSGMGGQDFNREQYGRQEFSQDQDNDRSYGSQRYNYGGWGDEDSRRQSSGRSGAMGAAAGYGASRMGGGLHDEHYSSWRQRQIEDLDRDYDEYRNEHRSKFENEFSGWRQQRQTKRQMLQSIREHTEVVDQNGERIGTVDKVRGDTIILTKNDPEAGGVHRSFSCSLLERVEGGKVYLSGDKDSIRNQLREERGDEDRNRSGGGMLGGLFSSDRDEDDRRRRDDQKRSSSMQTGQSGQSGQSSEGPHILDRSFSGTYDDKSDKTS